MCGRAIEPVRGAARASVKLAVLAMAVRRINSEVERRRRMRAATEHVESARRALAMKEANAGNAGSMAFNSRHAHHGMRNIASRKRQKLIDPMERGRLRKAAAVSPATRDAR